MTDLLRVLSDLASELNETTAPVIFERERAREKQQVAQLWTGELKDLVRSTEENFKTCVAHLLVHHCKVGLTIGHAK